MSFKNKVAAFVAAAALCVALPGAAFAATSNTYDENATAVTKTWEVSTNSIFASVNEQFSFQLTFTGAEAVGTYTPDRLTTDKTITPDWDWSNATGTEATKTFDFKTLLSGITFTNPGIYSFTLSENAGTDANIIYDDAEYTVKVQVVKNTNAAGNPIDGVSIQSVTVYQGEEKAPAVFANTPEPVAPFAISKTVTGNAASTADSFEFTINLAGGSGTFAIAASQGVNVPSTFTFGADGTAEITVSLMHGQTLSIANLPQTVTYTVTEADTAYTEQYKVNGGDLQAGLGVTTATALGEDGATVDFVNDKGITPPTGYLMTVAPFALVIVLAIAAGVLFLSRRRSENVQF